LLSDEFSRGKKALCALTRSVDTKRITAKAEDLAVHGVDGRLRQAFQLANMLAELVDDFLHMFENPNSGVNQLPFRKCYGLSIPHIRTLRALEDILSLELFHELVVELQIGRQRLLR